MIILKHKEVKNNKNKESCICRIAVNHLIKDTKHIKINQYSLGNPAISKKRPVAFRPRFTTSLAITLKNNYEKGFVQKKECNIKNLSDGNPAISKKETRGFPSPLHNGFGLNT